ncbi:MAG: ABC transporter permease subunit [Deltaproteobacteria bacterium]|jgi:phosphate transport system permease protein|nr:ABC transporter permease subunit [Deltaproteobacteria bacterium]
MNEKFRLRAKRNDRIAKWVITFGGMLVIFSVIFILVLIASTTLPLFKAPKAEIFAKFTLPKEPAQEILALGIDEYLETGFFVDRDGVFNFFETQQGLATDQLLAMPPDEDSELLSIEKFGRMQFGLFWNDGTLTLERVDFKPFFDAEQDNHRTILHTLKRDALFPPTSETAPEISIGRIGEEGRKTRIDLMKNGQILVQQIVVTETLFGDEEEETFSAVIDAPAQGMITALALDSQGKALYAGTEHGYLIHWSLSEPGEPELRDQVKAFSDGRSITALNLVFGDYSVAVGDAAGNLTTWFPVRIEENSAIKELKQIHTLAPHASKVLAIQPSLRDKSLLSLSQNGLLHLDHMTSQRHLLELGNHVPLTQYSFSTRSDGIIGMTEEFRAIIWKLDNPHPEVSWGTLFGKVWYEGYDQPEFVWQSSSANDDFEPKLSLTPLIYGTLKGTFYAMLFAVPLALFGAIYTSQFCRPRFRGIIKPTVEIMAAIPTVIIGFLAALWLAPIIERSLGAVFMSIVFIPVGLIIAIIIWQVLRRNEKYRGLERGYEFLAIAPVIVLSIAIATTLGPLAEDLLFNGDLKQWLFLEAGTRYDPRNCIVIAFGMGFAVIPIIFTIAEDSLSNVPPALKAASLACGASRWQTVWRVILPSASPGIFAGSMIGFGRAVGETMIVLMATGNTAIMDLSIFNGMRPLSSNIAVEIPEAPHGGTLYRTLFLSAVILFIMTFVVNTVAEVIRQRLRKKYGRF